VWQAGTRIRAKFVGVQRCSSSVHQRAWSTDQGHWPVLAGSSALIESLCQPGPNDPERNRFGGEGRGTCSLCAWVAQRKSASFVAPETTVRGLGPCSHQGFGLDDILVLRHCS
jgi:hypothetical protein